MMNVFNQHPLDTYLSAEDIITSLTQPDRSGLDSADALERARAHLRIAKRFEAAPRMCKQFWSLEGWRAEIQMHVTAAHLEILAATTFGSDWLSAKHTEPLDFSE